MPDVHVAVLRGDLNVPHELLIECAEDLLVRIVTQNGRAQVIKKELSEFFRTLIVTAALNERQRSS